MATAKKSTAKKPTKKATVKKTNTTTSTKSKKAEVKVSTKTTKTLSPVEQIKSLNIMSGFIYLILAVVTVIFLAPVSAKITLNIMAIDQLNSNNVAVLFPASETLFDVQIRYLIAGMLVLAAIGSFLLATKLRKNYEKTVNQSSSGIRWIILGITAGVTLEIISLIAGITDIMTLKLIGVAILLTTVFGWIADRSPSVKWVAFIAAMIAGFVAWLPIIGSLIGTTLYADARFGWHVYALAGLVLLSSLLIALNQYQQMKSKSGSINFTAREQRYLRLDLATKVLVVIILLSALAK